MKTSKDFSRMIPALILLTLIFAFSCERLPEEGGHYCSYCMHLMVGGEHCAAKYDEALKMIRILERRGYNCEDTPYFRPF